MRAVIEVVRELSTLLPRGGGRFLKLYVIASSLLAVLDIVALTGIAAVMPLVLGGGAGVSLPVVGEVGLSPVALLTLVGGVIMLKSALGIVLHWVLTRRFAAYELEIGDRLLASYLGTPWQERTTYNSAVLVRVADSGIANTVMGVLLPVAQVPAELATFAAVVVGVTVLDPPLAIVTLVYLALLGLGLVRVMSRRAIVAGRVNRDYAFKVATLLTEAVAAIKEITLRGRVTDVVRAVHDHRTHTVRARANVSFLSTAPRYVMEAGLVLGFALAAGVGYLAGGAQQAATAVGIFAVAGFRLVPALTRLQAVVTQSSSNVAHARTVLTDIRRAAELGRSATPPADTATLPVAPRALRLHEVSFAYPGARDAVSDLTLDVPLGSTLALVGASGSGKSTTVDLVLGLLEPTSGVVSLDDQPLTSVLQQWRSRVAYVPQDVIMLDGTIGQNVALTWEDDYDRERALLALHRAQADDLLASRADGLDARVGERGLGLSGGQRQRIGIARALYQDPLVLVLDEATSALDGETEARVAAAVADLAGEVTVITVAHRLATIRQYDQVCMLEEGRIVGVGTFDDLVRTVPALAAQAARAGIDVGPTA